MNRERLTPVLLALLAVLALAGAAATLDSARSGSLAGDGAGTGFGDSDAREVDFGNPPPPETPVTAPAYPHLLALVFAGAVLVSLVAAAVWVYREGVDALKQLVALVVPVAVLLVLLYLVFLANLGGASGIAGAFGSRLPQFPGGGSSGGASAAVSSSPPVVVAALLAAVLVAVLLVVVRATGDDAVEPVADPEPDDRTTEVAAIGEAAGRAADRIEGETTFANAVYRAWREMTDPLDLPRETSTPGEFAAAAVAAGMGREDVRELTDLFEATRYGGVSADETRERRAVEALRRIEREYGGK
ncbi:DUF4129 domain-containing protein [Halomarina litorea]|uniref:DUF4129 domain-containing protein n=1 Tax=Halomarina litorea TaxID=2961595 RepID=UPI0020C1CC8B|nr:DUF4129 domain-containing protein [Halomarina sp. BCD28]